jgi:hypothetical protein
MILKSSLERLECLFFHSWHYINHDCVCTTGQVLKINRIYTYKEDECVDIVRLLDVYKDQGYLYCTLYFFNRNKIATVRQLFEPDSYVKWQIMDDKEFDEIMSIILWQEVNSQNDIWEFDFGT